MKDIYKLIHFVSPYLVIPILLTGALKWRHISTPFRIYIIGAGLSVAITLLKSYVASSLGFYLSALLGVTVYGYLFHILLRSIINVNYIWISVAFIWLIIGWYSLQHGVAGFQLHLIIPFDIFMITFCGVYTVHYLRTVGSSADSSVFLLVLYLLVEFCVNLFLDMISNFLYAYFSDNLMDLLWKEIIPLYTVCKVIAIVWIIATVRTKLPSLDQMPSFDR